MLNSMTGHGDASLRENDFELTIEIEEQGSESDELQIEEEDQALVEEMVDLRPTRPSHQTEST